MSVRKSHPAAPTAAVALSALALFAASFTQPAFAGTASDWPCTWSTLPKATPSQAFPDGPFGGNGDITYVAGGNAGTLVLYLTTGGFWGVGNGTNSTYPPLSGKSWWNADDGLVYEFAHDGREEVVPSPLTFPGCPAANCTIPVGMTIGQIMVASPSLADGSWTASLWIDNATAQITLANAAGTSSLAVTVWVTATSKVVLIDVKNTGSSALNDVNITVLANENVLKVPVSTGCADPSTGQPLANCPTATPSGALPSLLYARKAASLPDSSPFFIDGIVSLAMLPGAIQNGTTSASFTTTSPVSFTTPQS
jgi:hypothetical protein